MPVYELNGVRPMLGDGVFIAETAVVVGDVHLGERASVWFGAVIRGDCFPVRIGARTNIQDNAVVHVTADEAMTTIGDDVTVGHAAVLHGCTVGDRCLVGIGAVILDGAAIGDDSLVGAGALVTPGTFVPPRSVVMGRPARIVRAVSDGDLVLMRRGAPSYVGYARGYLATTRRV